jgi:hypothetical protein
MTGLRLRPSPYVAASFPNIDYTIVGYYSDIVFLLSLRAKRSNPYAMFVWIAASLRSSQ